MPNVLFRAMLSLLGSMLLASQVAKEAPPTKGSRHRMMQLPPGGTSKDATECSASETAAAQLTSQQRKIDLQRLIWTATNEEPKVKDSRARVSNL